MAVLKPYPEYVVQLEDTKDVLDEIRAVVTGAMKLLEHRKFADDGKIVIYFTSV